MAVDAPKEADTCIQMEKKVERKLLMESTSQVALAALSVYLDPLLLLLMRVFPGKLRYIRKNLYDAVYVLDPASICGLICGLEDMYLCMV